MFRKSYSPWQPQSRRPRYPVVIVGGGAVGLTLMLALARRGVAALTLENDDQVCDGSRALGMAQRTVDIWDSLGIGKKVGACGVPWVGGKTFYRDKTILKFDLPADPAFFHPPLLNIQQSYVEQYLVDEIDRLAVGEVAWQTTCTGIEPDKDGVNVSVENPLGAATLSADYVVACDGARSTVRKACGLHMEGSSYEAEYVIVDVRMPSHSPIRRRAWFDPPWLPGATILMHGQPENIWRLDFQIRSGEKLEDLLQPDRLQNRVSSHLAAIGEPSDFEIVWATSYRAHSRLLSDFRGGRVFFAGDSAHLFPIFGIRGLNSGVEDAFNLAWKLDYALRGLGGERLLDSYSAERRWAALKNQRLANRAANFMTPPTRGARLMRDAVLSLAVSQANVRPLVNPRQATFIPLSDSPLNYKLGVLTDGAPLKPGHVLPNLRYADGSLYDLLDSDFSVVGTQQDVAPLLAAPERPDMIRMLQVVSIGPDDSSTICDRNGEIARLLGIADGRLLVVRPDHHVAAVAAPSHLRPALRKATAHER